MREGMSLQTRRELLQHMLPQYRQASTVQGDAPMSSQNLPHGRLRTWMLRTCGLQQRVPMQIRQDCFRTGNALEVFGRDFTDLQHVLDDQRLICKG